MGKHKVISQKYGKRYKLGNKVAIQVKSIDVQKKQIDYLLVK